ncbi:MAG: DUF7831 domain-containing protein [Candidatus Heimdallarchaeaceae archaeon]
MYITRKYVREHPEKIFVFGDNCLHSGYGGQAKEMRGEPNAYGIPTKRYPTMDENAFFTDDDFENLIVFIDDAIEKIPIDGREIVVLPLGTGLAQLPQRAPRVYKYLVSALILLKGKERKKNYEN